ncbi:dipeptide/oligopeptide/nickel ABC transporter permease/ATP-binding protein [Microbacterium paludicola]|nr:dipeptide/oligopeptide/nickel ABC transporter permease/ATP-binding protein [Microbacterium paludicola]
MTTSIPTPAAPRSSLAVRMLRNPLGLISSVYLALLLVVAVVGPFLTPHDPAQTALGDVLAAPSAEHLLGGDSAGRDVLSRLIAATSTSLVAAALAVAVAALIGVSAGLVAGYRGGWFDQVSGWLTATILSLPAIVVLLAARSVIGPSIWGVMAVFGVVLAPSYFRIVYAAVRGVREELYIDAARVAGLSDWRIVGRHILTAVRAPVILLTAALFAVAIAIQASLDFLGVGDPTVPTWGGMLSDGFYNLSRTPWLMVWPSLAIGLTCVALTLFGSALRDELEHAATGPARTISWEAPVVRPAAAVRHDGPTNDEPVLEIAGLSVAYTVDGGWKTVVDDVSISVGRGEVHALIGESGSGKTQTAWSVLGLLPAGGEAVAGEIRLDGTDLRTLRPAELAALRGRRIGYVPQEPLSNLDPSYTVGHQLIEPLRVVLGLSRAEARQRAVALLGRVGIADPDRVMRSYPHQISGGMAQRVLIAGAVATEPRLIIADEPTTALDVTVQAEILQLLRDLRRETGVSILLVTHNFGVVADLADRVSVMRAGSIVETGTVADVFAAPQHDYTKGLFAALLDDAPARGPLTVEETRA